MKTTDSQAKLVFHVIRYAPDLVRQEFVNIGILLYQVETTAPRMAVRITRNWGHTLSVFPDAPTEFFEHLEKGFLRVLPSGTTAETVAQINQQFSASLRLSSHLVLSSHKGIIGSMTFDEEMDRLMLMYVEPRLRTLESPDDNGNQVPPL